MCLTIINRIFNLFPIIFAESLLLYDITGSEKIMFVLEPKPKSATCCLSALIKCLDELHKHSLQVSASLPGSLWLN